MGTTNTFVNEHEKCFYQETLTKTDVLYQWFSQETFTKILLALIHHKMNRYDF